MRPRAHSRKPERDAEIMRMAAEGMPRSSIAWRMGITTQRVAQIILAEEARARSAAPAPRPQAPPPMSAVDADTYLDRAVAFECAPPWERHPQPTI